MANTKKKRKGNAVKDTRLSEIKKLIAMDDFHPGSLSEQSRITKSGKKSKYYSWQSSFQGKKMGYRLSSSQYEEVKRLIDNAKKKAKVEKRKMASEVKVHDDALKELTKKGAIERNRKGAETFKKGKDK